MVETDTRRAYNPLSEAYPAFTPRTAVCVSGQLRTLDMREADPRYPRSWAPTGMHGSLVDPEVLPAVSLGGRTVAESVYEFLYPALGEFDVFMHVGTRETPTEPAAGNTSACDSLAPRATERGRLVTCDIYHETVLPQYPTPEFTHYYYFDAANENETLRLQQSLLQQLYGMYRCKAAIERQERLSGVRYDYIVRYRPDTAFFRPMPGIERFNYGSPEAPTVHIVHKDLCQGGNEDWVRGSRGRRGGSPTWHALGAASSARSTLTTQRSPLRPGLTLPSARPCSLASAPRTSCAATWTASPPSRACPWRARPSTRGGPRRTTSSRTWRTGWARRWWRTRTSRAAWCGRRTARGPGSPNAARQRTPAAGHDHTASLTQPRR